MQDPSSEEEHLRRVHALQKLTQLRKLAGKDKLPCQVAEGLYIGPIGAARNLKALRKCGITHIINASPVVPCYFRDNPEGAFVYHLVPIYDDAAVDLTGHIEEANDFIEAGIAAGGILVHCYAGQSRSAAFVMAFLIGRRGMTAAEAWAVVRRARPCAHPNSGFLHQLAAYERASRGPALSSDSEEGEGEGRQSCEGREDAAPLPPEAAAAALILL